MFGSGLFLGSLVLPAQAKNFIFQFVTEKASLSLERKLVGIVRNNPWSRLTKNWKLLGHQFQSQKEAQLQLQGWLQFRCWLHGKKETSVWFLYNFASSESGMIDVTIQSLFVTY